MSNAFGWALFFSLLAPRAYAKEIGYPIEEYDPGSYEGRIFGCCDWRHLGEDIVNEPLTPVYAIADGAIVPISGAGCYFGMVVVIEHHLSDGTVFTSLYGHLSNRVGHKPRLNGDVSKGDVVGYVAHSGGRPLRHDCRKRDDENGDGESHLHFGIRFGPAPKRADGRYEWVYFGYAGSGQDVDFDAAGRQHGGKFTSPVKFLAQFGITPPHTDDDTDNFSENDGDCDDTDKFVRPDTFERCQNGKDDNCDGVTDEALHPLGEQCLFKYNGCLVSAVWICINGQTLCKPEDITNCLCRDECEDVGGGECIDLDGAPTARICAVDHATGCTRWIYQQCAACNGGRCVRQGQGGECASNHDCRQHLECVRDRCTERNYCMERCQTSLFEVQHGNCPGCLTCTPEGYCINGRGVSGAALGIGCPCESSSECSVSFDDRQGQCADGLTCLTCVFGAVYPVRSCLFGGDVECKCLPSRMLLEQPNSCEGW